MEIPERDQEQSSGQEEKRNAPTVSKEKWKAHAINKMSKGYVLIVGTERRNANFYQPGKGYEMCAFDIARRLVKEGVVVKAYDHYLGTAYRLSEGIALPPRPAEPPQPAPQPADEGMGALLDDLEKDLEEDAEDVDD